MAALHERMGDPNGNFLREFQGDGFHSRLLELASFAYLESAGLLIDRSNPSPDYLVSREAVTVGVEVTSANPPDAQGGQRRDISARGLVELSDDELLGKVAVEFPRRIRSALEKKVSKRYQELAHCRDRALVVIVGSFFEPGSVLYADDALVDTLFVRAHDGGPAFFAWQHASSVSAVVYCNQFTVSRFFRLATTFGDGAPFGARRSGTCLVDRSATAFAYTDYSWTVGDPRAPEELWHEGVTLFVNPRARVPLADGVLPWTSRFAWTPDGLRRDLAGFHPVTSVTQMYPTADAQHEL